MAGMARHMGSCHSLLNSYTLLALSLLLLPSLSSATCFTPNGTNINALKGFADNEAYAPCNNFVTGASMCCAIGPARSQTPDRCFQDGSGLCAYQPPNGRPTRYWRESCTDPTWTDPACVKLFTNGTNQEGDVELRRCDDGSFCLRNLGDTVSRACCEAGEGLFVNIINGQVSVDETLATAPGPRPTPTPTPSAEPTEPSGLSAGSRIGIGVGGALAGFAALSAILWCIFAQQRRRRRDDVLSPDRESRLFHLGRPPRPPTASTGPVQSYYHTAKSELEGDTPRSPTSSSTPTTVMKTATFSHYNSRRG